MDWQDYAIAACQIGFIVALIPTLTSKNKPPMSTSFMNMLLLSVITFCMFTLQLYFSAVTALAITITWGFVGLQVWRQDRIKK